jgi:hypothetical protein
MFFPEELWGYMKPWILRSRQQERFLRNKESFILPRQPTVDLIGHDHRAWYLFHYQIELNRGITLHYEFILQRRDIDFELTYYRSECISSFGNFNNGAHVHQII